jgi:CRP/FNR family transcriptional regulator
MTSAATDLTRKTVSAAAISSSQSDTGNRGGQEMDPLDRVGFGVEFGKGRTIYYESDEARHYFEIVSGVVRLCKVTEDGRRQIMAFLTAGDLFGWATQDHYSYSAEAVTPVSAVKYSRRRVEALVRTDPTVGRRVLVLLSNQLALAHDHLLLLGRMTASERISVFLLTLTRRRANHLPDARIVELPMNRRDIADYLGLTIETVSRTMSAMKRKGVLSYTYADSVHLNGRDTLDRTATAAPRAAIGANRCSKVALPRAVERGSRQ